MVKLKDTEIKPRLKLIRLGKVLMLQLSEYPKQPSKFISGLFWFMVGVLVGMMLADTIIRGVMK